MKIGLLRMGKRNFQDLNKQLVYGGTTLGLEGAMVNKGAPSPQNAYSL